MEYPTISTVESVEELSTLMNLAPEVTEAIRGAVLNINCGLVEGEAVTDRGFKLTMAETIVTDLELGDSFALIQAIADLIK